MDPLACGHLPPLGYGNLCGKPLLLQGCRFESGPWRLVHNCIFCRDLWGSLLELLSSCSALNEVLVKELDAQFRETENNEENWSTMKKQKHNVENRSALKKTKAPWSWSPNLKIIYKSSWIYSGLFNCKAVDLDRFIYLQLTPLLLTEISKYSYLSAETVIRCLRSFANLTPVTTSECPYMLATNSPVWKSRIHTFLSVLVVAT